MSAQYTFQTASEFKKFLVRTYGIDTAKLLFCVFVTLQAKFHDDKIIAHNICVLAAQGEQPYMIEEIILNEYATV